MSASPVNIDIYHIKPRYFSLINFGHRDLHMKAVAIVSTKVWREFISKRCELYKLLSIDIVVIMVIATINEK